MRRPRRTALTSEAKSSFTSTSDAAACEASAGIDRDGAMLEHRIRNTIYVDHDGAVLRGLEVMSVAEALQVALHLLFGEEGLPVHFGYACRYGPVPAQVPGLECERVAGLEHRGVDRLVGLRAGMRLHVDIACAE